MRFARLHLANGRTDSGAELVAATSIKEMAAHQIDLPVPELGSFGLGWARNDRGETLILSHTGGSIGGLS